MAHPFHISEGDPVLVTGASGFIGAAVIDRLLARGFRNLRALVRPTGDPRALLAAVERHGQGARVEILRGNLLSPEDCRRAASGIAVILHLAASRGEKSYPDAFMNSVITTRNLLEAARGAPSLRRFVNVSSFTVYSNRRKPRGRLLDEECALETEPELRHEAYCFAKVKQDELVAEYGRTFNLPVVTIRPGSVYGPGRDSISGRVGIGTFGLFLHLGGSNRIPLTYVDNCAEAIVLAGVTAGVDGEVFNVVDDDPPTSRAFLRLYKRNVRRFPSLYVPPPVSYGLCWLWESYSRWSEGQLPAAFNRRRWHTDWKPTRYSNEKLKRRLGWRQVVPAAEGLRRYFDGCRGGKETVDA